MAVKHRIPFQKRWLCFRVYPWSAGALLSLCLFLANPSFAELKWESTTKTIEVHPLQSSVRVAFAFSNASSKPIEIMQLKPTCGCISGKLVKKVYQPGEAGCVELLFNLENREGPQRKGLEVKTSDGKTTSLYISTHIAPSFTFSAKRLIWETGEERIAKRFLIQNQHQQPFRVREVILKQEGISVELITKRDGFEYELVVVPEPGVKNALIPITLLPETPDGVEQVKTFTAYALLK
jgi:hypothetical protein